MRLTGSLRLALAATVAFATGCGQSVQPPPVRNFDRPSDVAFTCYGDLRVEDGATVRTAQPVESCAARARGEVPPGQEDVLAPELYGLVLQSARGTVAVVHGPTGGVLDSDTLSPGKNDIPVGSLPVDIVTDESGCFALTANAGSCDLSILDVGSSIDLSRSAEITRTPITSGGESLRTKPRAFVAAPQTRSVGAACPAEPQGIGYLAYPSCDLVAAVDLATGELVGGIAFDDDGSARAATDADFACPVECGDGALALLPGGSPADAGTGDAGTGDGGVEIPEGEEPGQPVALTVHQGENGSTRLFIGGEDSAVLTIVELGEDDLPAGSIRQVRLEGEVGIRDIAVSGRIAMGGDAGELTPPPVTYQFAYVIATDGTIRVVDLGAAVECDAQVDPRYLQEVRDPAVLACMPVGAPSTPPRRAGARSPGIELPAVPTSVEFATIDIELDPALEAQPMPSAMVGTFAFVTAANGFVFVINVDDDNYPDREDPDDPIGVFLTLAMPHQLRDLGANRSALAQSCSNPASDPFQLGPRLAAAASQVITPAQIAPEKLHQLPYLRGVSCEVADSAGEVDSVPVSELSFAAPDEVRESAFPDLRSVRAESWFLIWEGPLSVDGNDLDVDGPAVRRGLLSIGDDFAVTDPAAPFCSMGVEPYDIVQLVGCDPTLGDAQCSVGEVCHVHPDSPATVTSGLCLPDDRVDALSAACRDLLVSRRQFTVQEVRDDRLVLGERARILRTTPVAGCESDAQCAQLAEVDRALREPEHPIELELEPEESAPEWACRPDPTRAPGPDACVMVCTEDADCDAGSLCSGGICVTGTEPPSECAAAIQRYQVRVGEAFSLIGDRTGFLHNWVRDPDSGECVLPAEPDPLLVGRVPLSPPPCDDDGDPRTGPNPCRTVVESTETVTPFEPLGQTCQAQGEAVVSRDAEALRIENPVFRFHLVDPETSADAVCRGDRAADLPPFAAVYPGYQITFDLTGAFIPMFVPNVEAAFPTEVVTAPGGQLWVLDEGDASAITRGRVFILAPRDALNGFSVRTLL